MSVEFPQPGTSSLVDRVKNILLKPQEEWRRIDAEPATVADIFKSYVVPLAAIGPVALLVGSLLFGYSLLLVTFRPSIGFAISVAVSHYIMALVNVFVLSLIFNLLAPNFGGQKSDVQATKVAACSCTAAWVAGVFLIFPGLAFLAILGGLYSLYLLYLGLPRLMKVPEDKALTYVIVSIVAAFVVFFITNRIAMSLDSVFAPSIIPGGTLTVS
ncbi:Yip1 family protein [Sphingomonas tabacisoli]|uniref:Yip1 family protein n=1 Tax=Sphingomonas tabacisoli TaxID=2249466 RepID=A0ABW4I649_9SPHN